jgi:hypothetical protein
MQKIKVRPGYVILSTCSATGGVHYARTHGDEQPIGEDGVEQEIRSVKTIDHKEAVDRCNKIASAANHAVRKRTANSAFGYFATADALTVLSEDLRQLSDEAAIANAFARSVGSARRVHVGIVPVEIDVANEDVAREVHRTVRVALTEIRDHLIAGEAHELKLAIDRAVRIDTLVTGLASESIRMALDSAKEARSELAKANKLRDDGDVKAESTDVVLKRVIQNYSGAIETALAWTSDERI